MSEETRRYTSVAPLRNVQALGELIARVKNRGPGLPGMACFYGPSGYGKTTAATFAANRFGANTVQVKSTWTKKDFCLAVLEDLGISPARTISGMLSQIAEELAVSRKPLLIDEADHLVARNMIELARDIYESSGSPVILIGEEDLPRKLLQWERVHNRMLDWVGTEPAALEDVGHLALIYAPGIELAADLKTLLLDASGQSHRRICVNLDRIREFAHTANRTAVSAADWAGRSFFTGAAPSPRKYRP